MTSLLGENDEKAAKILNFYKSLVKQNRKV